MPNLKKKRGDSEERFLADLVVLSDAIDKICVTQIGNLCVELTLLNGKIIFERNQIFGLSPS